MKLRVASLKRRLRPYKHAIYRFIAQQRIAWHRLYRHETPIVRRIVTNTHTYLARTLAPRELAQAYIAIDSAQSFVPPPATTLGSSKLTTSPDTAYRAMFVAHVSNATILGYAGHIVAKDDALLADISFRYPEALYGDSAWDELFRTYGPARMLQGRACLMVSKWAGDNYFHYLFEMLPRLEMLRRTGIGLDTIEHWIVNVLLAPVYWTELETLGVPRDRIHWCGAGSAFQVEHLIAPSTLNGTGHMRPWVCDWLNRVFAPQAHANAPARLYVGRDDAKTRHLANQTEILDHVLTPLGFDAVQCDGRSIREQAALFSNAEVVVGVNGAALSNLVFCKPGTRVIVLHYPIYLSRYFYELSHTVGLEYYYLVGETTPLPGARDYTADYFVNPDALTTLLKLAQVN